MFKPGIDVLLRDTKLIGQLRGKRLGLVGHPASVSVDLHHSLDLLLAQSGLKVTCAFGPQHGMRGEKQDNMIESDDYADPKSGVPVHSLYGRVRRPTAEMLDQCDVVLFDLQDVGCRIYTYITTLMYMMEGCRDRRKALWVLDRPNPAGRPIEGNYLEPGFESFVGFGRTVMRHGCTLGEMALWMKKKYRMDLDLKVIPMEGYDPTKEPGYGFPTSEFSWVNPSPNMPTLDTARVFCGTVLLEGTNLSEGRGTTRPLQLFGAPGLETEKLLIWMLTQAPEWMDACRLRPAYFEPTFHKFHGQLCAGLQIHVDDAAYQHQSFTPYRLMLLFFKALRSLQSERFAWRQPPYEYENERLPIDLLSGSTFVRDWVDDPGATPKDFDEKVKPDENAWSDERRPFLLYPEGP